MPFNHLHTDHSPLFHERELIINDIQLLAEQVGLLLLGKHRHVASILAAKTRRITLSTEVMIDKAQKQLTVSTDEERWKRDGWLFQMMTWISVRLENPGVTLISQAPHTNSAQHGIDGLAIILTSTNQISALIIAEDKYTENPRKKLREEVWPEFKLFEEGKFDSALVTQVTMLLNNLSEDDIDAIIENDLYNTANRIYRAGITPLATDITPKQRKKLFKGFNVCVSGTNQERRQALTFNQPHIRNWMDNFSLEIYNFLETQKP